MTNEENRRQTEALIIERAGVKVGIGIAEKQGDQEKLAKLNERIEAIDAELRRFSGEGKVPSKRAETRKANK